MTRQRLGGALPRVLTPPPGPESRRLSADLARYETPGVSGICTGDIPIVWSRARGANVVDVDGNVYIDMTGGFGVANAGHGNPRVAGAAARQAGKLVHGLGDVHPNEARAALVSRLAQAASLDGEPHKAMLCSTGADAVEFALKTSSLYTGKPGVLAFEGGFHGQSYGALAVTHRELFRKPFERQIFQGVARVPFPYCYRCPIGKEYPACSTACMEAVEQVLDSPPAHVGPIGAVIVEPVQGRGGEIVPPAEWLPRLAAACKSRGVLLILDEMITGFGRTGAPFAATHWGVVPDLMCVGKGMANGYPVAACIGRADVMDAWRHDSGEAPHSSTFMGHPVTAAAAMASMEEQERRGLQGQARRKGAYALRKLEQIKDRRCLAGDVRGLGLMLGVELVKDRGTKEPAGEAAREVVDAALHQGIILLAGGPHGNVVSLTPPLTITRRQLDCALETLDECLERVWAVGPKE